MNCQFRKVASLKPGQNARSKEEFKKESLKELVKSIEQFGVAIPLIIKPDGEIIAGHRRHAAAVLAGIEDVPVVVYEGGEISAEEIAMLENQHRQGLRLMDEIQAVLHCLENEETTDTIMSRLGMTRHQVALRRNVAKNLSPTWKKAITEGQGDCTAEHLDLIARLPTEVQDSLLEEALFVIVDGNMSVTQLKGYIAQTCERDLKSAPWNDEEMYGDGKQRRCEGCPNRSDAFDQADLFPSPAKKKKNVLCLDAECFKMKQSDWIRFKAKEWMKLYPKMVVASPADASYNRERETHLHAITQALSVPRIDLNQYKSFSSTAEDTIPVFILHDDLSMSTGTYKLKKGAESEAAPAKPGRPALVTMEQKKQALHGARLKSVYDALCGAIEKHPGPTNPLETLALLVALGGSCGRNIPDPIKYPTRFASFVIQQKPVPYNHPWDEKVDKMDADPVKAGWMQVQSTLVRKLKSFSTAIQCAEAEQFATVISNVIGFEWSKAMEQAILDKPEPKSWKKKD